MNVLIMKVQGAVGDNVSWKGDDTFSWPFKSAIKCHPAPGASKTGSGRVAFTQLGGPPRLGSREAM